MNRTIRLMLNGDCSVPVPSEVMDFIEKQFHFSLFESRKKSYLTLMTVKKSNLLDHLKTAYHLIEFWKNMFLKMVAEDDFEQLQRVSIKSEPTDELVVSEIDDPVTTDVPLDIFLGVDPFPVVRECGNHDDSDQIDDINVPSIAEGDEQLDNLDVFTIPLNEEQFAPDKSSFKDNQSVFDHTNLGHFADSPGFSDVTMERGAGEKVKRARRGKSKSLKKRKSGKVERDFMGKVEKEFIYGLKGVKESFRPKSVAEAVEQIRFEGMNDFSSCKKKFDEYRAMKKTNGFGGSKVYQKLVELMMKSLFKDGKLVDCSDDALYFLHHQRMRKREREKKEKQVICRVCNKKLSSFSYEHMLTAHGHGYSCPACEIAEFPHSKELMAHFREIHWEDAPLNCNICPDVAFSPRDLHVHILRHTDTQAARVRCGYKFCGFYFRDEEAMNVHVAKEHRLMGTRGGNQKDVEDPGRIHETTCEECGKLIKAKSEAFLRYKVINHKRSNHQKKPICPHCGKICAGKFRDHFERCRIPTTTRPYKCNFGECNKSFRTQTDMNLHRIYHMPPKFSCQKCLKPYYYMRFAKVHEAKCKAQGPSKD